MAQPRVPSKNSNPNFGRDFGTKKTGVNLHLASSVAQWLCLMGIVLSLNPSWGALRAEAAPQPNSSRAAASNPCASPQWQCWQSAVGIQIFDQFQLVSTCTGVAISPRQIVTAAHCTEIALSGRPLLWRVSSLAELDGSPPTFLGTTSNEAVVFNPPLRRHPRYNAQRSRYRFDWAIIEISHRFPSARIWPKAWTISHGQQLHRIGYGGRPNALGELTNRRTWITSFLESDLNPADDVMQSQDAFGVPGDSGGPLFVWYKQQAWLVGLHSTWDTQLGLSLGPRLP